MTSKLNAADDLVSQLNDGETVEGIVFGPWGWGSAPKPGDVWKREHDEPNPPAVPFDKRGTILSFDDARPYMQGWSFFGGYGAPGCYAVRVWTNQRVFWVTQYDGSTQLDSAPRHPIAIMPDMPGG